MQLFGAAFCTFYYLERIVRYAARIMAPVKRFISSTRRALSEQMFKVISLTEH